MNPTMAVIFVSSHILQNLCSMSCHNLFFAICCFELNEKSGIHIAQSTMLKMCIPCCIIFSNGVMLCILISDLKYLSKLVLVMLIDIGLHDNQFTRLHCFLVLFLCGKQLVSCSG